MSKPKLISTESITLWSDWLIPVVTQYFDLVKYDPLARYDSCDCYYTGQWDSIAIDWASSGRKVAFDMLWEPTYKVVNTLPCHVLQHINWMWYQESLWYRHLEYHTYIPELKWTHHALMPIRLQKPSRDFVVKYIGDKLDCFIWSYQAKNKHLPGSGDPEDGNTQRQFVPDWYNNTAMSLVLESSVHSRPLPLISEKTFKPIAFKHPFVVCGDYGTLRHLHSLGFETFDNLYDEGYDLIDVWQLRCKTAVDQCLKYKPEKNQRNKITQDKLDHNHSHFFNQELVIKKISQEILEPLLDYAET